MSQNLSIFEQAGKDIPEGLSDNKVKTIFEATGLDWVVEQKEVAVLEKDNNYSFLRNYVANYRSDNNQFLGMVHPKD